MMPAFLFQAAQTISPDDCIITGLCGGRPDQVGPSSGLMFLALGFVALGGWGLWKERRRKTSATSGNVTIPS